MKINEINVRTRKSSTGAQITVEELLKEEHMDGKCGLFARVTMEPGAVLGYHEHHGETETYYILSGTGEYDDNGTKVPAAPGDIFFCEDGCGHDICCTGSEPLSFMALIIKGGEKGAELLESMRRRRSVRKYTGEAVPEEILEKVLRAGLLSPSSRAIRPWEFIVVRDRKTLEKMSECRVGAAKMLAYADTAVVVVADGEKQDVWTEDCSIAMAYMHLAADSLGLGSCWIQGRLREAEDGRTTEEYLRDLLKFPETHRLEAILSLGMPQEHGEAYPEDSLLTQKIHREKF